MRQERLKGHSAAFLTEQRDYWWNEEFLRLIVARLGVEGTRSLLDVGCGLGHWSRALGRVLQKLTTVVGLDAESAWVQRAALTSTDSVRTAALRGTAQDLPFADSAFDLVTCQTLLIHVADPRAVLQEMARVARPGGVVIAAEPCNRASQLVRTSFSADWPIEKMLRYIDFYLRCEEGKLALGLGDNSVGDLLPGYFLEAGMTDISVSLSDRPSPLWPPYDEPGQRAVVDSLRVDVDEGHWWGWTDEEARAFYVAGGGSPAAFEAAWTEHLRDLRAEYEAVLRGEVTTGGGQLVYLIAGRVPV